MPEYKIADTASEYVAAANLFREYAEWLNIDLSFQHFKEELGDLESMYAPPGGTVILCKDSDSYIGCVAIRLHAPGIAELKRMYVQPGNRHLGVGQELLSRAIQFATDAGYHRIRLDTLDTMLPAMRLYEKNGFTRIPAYYHNPESNAVYYEKLI